MGWSLGWDSQHKRDIGYGVPALCDHPGCNEKIDRGLAYVCGHGHPYGGEEGCGLFFCPKHGGGSLCERCAHPDADGNVEPFTPKPDVKTWLRWKLTHASWKKWRKENPEEVAATEAAYRTAP